MTIKVTDDGKGYLVAETSVDGDTAFTNTYKAESVSYSVSQDVKVSKTLTGRDLRAGEFEFELVENGNVVATASNDAKGNVNFDALEYDEAGTHTYVVREAKGYSRQKGYLDRYLGSEYSIAFLPKIEISVCVGDDRAEEAADQIVRAARTGRIGDGKIFVVPVAYPDPLEF